MLASNGWLLGLGAVAGAKRVGEAAKGTPRYLCTTVADAPETDVVVPTITPASIVAVGAAL